MTSKEALEMYHRVACYHSTIIDDSSHYKTIKKDLERLEKLEKIIEILKKSFLLSVIEIREHYYVCAHDNNYFMKKEEYELLKEVTKNDKKI